MISGDTKLLILLVRMYHYRILDMRKKIYNIQLRKAIFILPFLIGFANLLKANTYVVTHTGHDGVGSFKHAISRANAHAGTDKIVFSLPNNPSSQVIQLGRDMLHVTDELIIDGFENRHSSVSGSDEKIVKIFLDTEGGVFRNLEGVFSLKNTTFRGIGLAKNNSLKIQNGVRLFFENCIFLNDIRSANLYIEGVFVNDDNNLKNCLIENEPSDLPKLDGNTFGKFIRQFSKILKVSGFDFAHFVNKNVDLSLISKNVSNCNVLKLYTDTVNTNNDLRVLYRLTPKTDTIPGSGGEPSNVLSIIISENAVIVAQPNDISECVGGNQQMTIAISGGTGNITYQWQVSSDGINFTNVPGANATVYTPPATVAATSYYRVVISSDVAGCGPITSTAATVAVLADPTVSLSAIKDIICDGESASITAATSGGSGDLTYIWQSSTDGTNWSEVAGSTGSILTTPALTITTQFRVIVRQGSGCETTSAPITIQMGSCNGLIGNYVWLDCNKNGIQEADEKGVSGVTIKLKGKAVTGENVDRTVSSESNGQYRFTGVKPGKYKVVFGFPPQMTGLGFTLKKQNNNVVDSDADADGQTDEIVFGSNQVVDNLDAGYVDVTPPVVTPASDLVIVCNGSTAETELNDWLLNHGGATAVDNFTTGIIWTNNYSTTIKTCGGAGEAKVTFTATDDCGNSQSTVASLKVVDNQAPVFATPPSTLTLSCGDAIPAPVTPSVSDLCDPSPTVIFEEKRVDLCGISYRLTRMWTATDACGNSSTTTQIITLEDREAPQFKNVPPPITLTCSDIIPPGSEVVAVDNCDGNPRVTMSDLIERGICNSNFKINRLWTAVDACGNLAKVTQVITVGDNDAPQITGVPADISLTCGSQMGSPSKNVRAYDLCSSSVRLSVNDKVSRGPCPDNYLVARTWTATDACGNVTTKTQKITVNDNIKPELINVPANITVKLYLGQRVPTKPNIVATDNCDSRVDVAYVETRENNLCGYVLKRKWTATDNCRNIDEKTQIITVRTAENDAIIASVTPENCNEKNGSAVLSPSIPNYTYTWSDGKTGYTRNDLSSGTYKVTATSSANCSVELTVVIKRECDCDRPIVSVSKQDLTCNTTEASASISIANALPSDLKFIWLPKVSGSNKASNLAPGNYKVRVERANKPSCFTEINFTINDNVYVDIQEPAITPSNCNTSSGRIAFIVPQNDSLTFKWSDSETIVSPVRTGLASGIYTVTVTRPNSSACPLIKTVEIKSDNPLKAPFVINRQPSCGLPNGAVTINTTGGSGDYKYSWGEGNSRFVLPSGPINVTVTDMQTGCFTVVSFVLSNQSPVADISMDSTFVVTCPGMSDGRATFNVSYGTDFKLPAKFEIRDFNNNLFSNGALPAGTNYSLLVKDSLGCLATSKRFDIINPLAVVPSFTKINQSCDALGSISVNVTGGTGNYKFSWADLGYQNDQPASRQNLKAGAYSVTIADAVGCQKVIRNIRILDSCACRPAVIDNIDMVNATCGESNGAANIILRGGNEGNYTYNWSPASGTPNAIGNGRTGLASGIYNVTISSKTTLSCTTVTKVAVGTHEGPTNVGIDISPATCEASNGAAAFSSNENLIYTWLFDGKVISARNDLKEGLYQVLVTRASTPNCPSTLQVKIGSRNNLTGISIINQRAACGSANGVATVRVLGGSGKYQYSWGTDSIRRDLKAGVYVVTVTDLVTNCKVPITLSMPEETVAEVSIMIFNPTVSLNCTGNKNGRVNYKVSYGNGFTYPSQVYIVDGNGRIWANDSLAAGSYCIIIKDATGCVAASKCFEVREPAPISAVVVKTNKTCTVGGRIILSSVKGGSGFYQYAWSDQTGLSSNSERTGLNIGSYSVTIYDSKGCNVVIDTIKIASDCPNEVNYCDNFSATAKSVNKTCTEGGRISLNISGGTAPYSFDWQDLDLTNNPQNRLGLSNGTYSVTITDAAGCRKELTNIIITNTCVSEITCTPPTLGDIKVTDASCAKSTGQIVVNVVRPTNVIYKWLPNVSTTNTAQNLAAGIYKLKICSADDTSCFTERDIVVKNQDGIAIGQPTITPATCSAANGKIEFLGLGRTLIYEWSDGKTGSVRNDLAKGVYTIAVSDPSGEWCKQITSVEIPAINGLVGVAMIDKRSICGQATGQATIKPVGGSGSFTYSWGNSATKSDLKAGIYNVTVTDNQTGCQAVVQVIMTDDVQGYATVNVSQPIIYLACAGEKNASVVYNLTYSSGFQMPSRVVIADNLGRTALNDNLAAGRYAIFVYDKNNCLAGLGNFEVREPKLLILNVSAAPQLCTKKGSISLDVSGGSGVYSYQWSDLTGSNQPKNRTDLYAGDYYITVNDTRGCSKVAKVTVRNESFNCIDSCDLQAYYTASPKTCIEGGAVSLTILNGSGTYGYLWSDLGTVSAQPRDRKDLNPGIYSVIIIDSTTNCRVKLTNITIENQVTNCRVNTCLIVANANVKHSFCQEAGIIRLNVIEGVKPFTFDWLDLPGVDNPQNRFNLLPGKYTLVITDSVACKDTLLNIVVKDSCFTACSIPTINNINVTDADCFTKNGSISISMTDATGYVYKWMPNVSKTNTATGLAAGLYKVRIARAEDTLCFVDKDILVGSKNDALAIGAPTITDATCGMSNGVVTVNGAANWTYRWNDGASGRVRQYLAPNTYYVTVTDPSVSGCPKVQEIVVQSNGSLQVSARVDRQPNCGSSNGQVTILTQGGSGNYNFSWGSAVRSNLSSGQYEVSVYDNETGCSGVVFVNLTDQIPAGATIKINTTQFKQKCKGDENGNIDFTVTYASGFVQPAVVKIINEAGNTVENNQLKAGRYKILVNDGNGCVAAVTEFELSEPEMISTQLDIKAANCENLGKITLLASGGVGGYSYDWTDIAGSNDTKDRENLPPGIYAVTIKDANGCMMMVKDLLVANLCANAKPQRDTVYKTLNAGKVDTVCLPFEASFAGQAVTHTFCDGSSSVVNNYGFANVSADGCISIKTGTTTGRYELCVKTCISIGVCDTTVVFVNIVKDPSVCQTSYLGASTVSVSKCDSLATVCTDIPYNQMNNYAVTVNALDAQFYTTGCQLDTTFTYSYYSLTKFYPTGPWDLDSWSVDSKVFKAKIMTLEGLVDSLNNWDGNGNWVLNNANKTIAGGKTGRTYGSMAWKRSGRRVTTLQPRTLVTPAVLSLKLPVGTHKVVFTNKLKNCKDSTTITVLCNQEPIKVGNYTIDTIMYVGQRDTICFNNGAWATQSTITNVCDDIYKGFVGYTIDETTDCIRLVGSGTGRDTLCLKRNFFDGSTDTVKMYITVKPSVTVSDTACIDVYSGPDYYNVICGTQAQLCTNLYGADTLNYAVTLNGVPFTTGFRGCTGDTSYSYNYYSLVVSNPRGPWNLNPWIVNGNTYSGMIPTMNALVDSMNKWDAGGNWVLDGANYAIKGGKSGNNYGNMTWYKNNTSTKIASLGPNRSVKVGLIGMLLNPGRHQIIFKNIQKGCSDTANVLIECRQLRTRPSMTFQDTAVYINETNRYCLPTNGLLAANTKIATICNTKGYMNYVVDDASDCIVISGVNVGNDTICLQRCDFDGECDTLKIAVNVLKRTKITTETIFHSISVGRDSQYCVSTKELTGRNFKLTNICQTNSTNNVTFMLNGTCVNYFADGQGIDTACLVLCDELGNCDTTRLIVYVIQERQKLPTPIAVRDLATTTKNTQVVIKPIDNDSIFGLPSNILVLSQPSNGRLSFDPETNNVVYSPIQGTDCINRDSFRYAVVNVAGQDTAEISVEILCDEIVVFSGFSPNGDGVNDNFTILGLEKYPDNKILIFNQRGNQVFSGDTYQNTWNGTADGVTLPNGTYFWILELGNNIKQSGYVQIHR